MKILLVLSVSLALAFGQQGGGFFSNIGSAFNNFFGGRQPQQQRRPIRQQQFAQPAQQPQQPQQPQFAPQPQQFQQQPQAFQPQQTQFQQTQFQPQQSFQQPPAQPQQQFFQPQPPRQAAPAPPALRGGTTKCPAHEPNHFWTDPNDNRLRGYVVTWKFTDDVNPGCSKMQQHEAKEYCQSMGMEPVSLDSPAKQDEFNKLIASDAQRYFWTGGIVDHGKETVFWSNRNGAPVRFDDSRHWSHTGGAQLPQPDNRALSEEGIAETCLGILNNFYADGIKWHDVACHHKKPTVCEPTN